MDFEHRLRNGLTIEQLEEIVSSSNEKEDLAQEIARGDLIERNKEARELWLSKEREKAEIREALEKSIFKKLQIKKRKKNCSQMQVLNWLTLFRISNCLKLNLPKKNGKTND